MGCRKLTVAIDGPAGAGKSTVAREVARALGYLYVDSGAMYRAVALRCLLDGIDVRDEVAVSRAAAAADVRLVDGAAGVRVLLDGEDVTAAIRRADVGEAVPHVAKHPAVREALVRLQRQMSAGGGVVMDGRDIGTVVLPEADVKVFLTASPEERARRRYRELVARGDRVTYGEVLEAIQRRDRVDSSREHSPLVKAEDAVEIDTTGRSVGQVVDEILALCARKGGAVCST